MAKLSRQHIKQYFTKYSTTPTVTVYNPTVAILYFTLVITAFCMYFASIEFKLQKLYQRECPIQGTTYLLSVTGVASSENIVGRPDVPASYRRKWDVEELLYPASRGEGETGGFTLVTNMDIIENQTRGRCEALYSCEEDNECEEGIVDSRGVLTGKCIQDKRACEAEGWCPSKPNTTERVARNPLLEDVRNFTVVLRSLVDFPKCGEKHGNNLDFKDLIKGCSYDPVEHPKCPSFQIGDLVNRSNANFKKAAFFGGVFRIRMIWDCNFDFGWKASSCVPKYVFSAVINEYNKPASWSFRLPVYHRDGTRTQQIMHGLKFRISVEGKGRQFHFFTFIINLGASTGLLFVAPFVCDLILSVYEKFGSFGSNKEVNNGETVAVDTRNLDKDASPCTVVPMDQIKY